MVLRTDFPDMSKISISLPAFGISTFTKSFVLVGSVSYTHLDVYKRQSLISLNVQIQVLENTISLLMGEPSHEIERTSLSAQNFKLKTDLGFSSSLLANRADVKQAEFNLINACLLYTSRCV